MNDLSKELATFQKHLPDLLGRAEGKFALVIGDEVVGTFDTYADAVQDGYEKNGLTPFLVKRISQIEESASFSRPLVLCQA